MAPMAKEGRRRLSQIRPNAPDDSPRLKALAGAILEMKASQTHSMQLGSS